MNEQLSMFPLLQDGEDAEDLINQIAQFKEYKKQKRNWENAFQNWSDKAGMNGLTSYGVCGYSTICDWCKDNTYGRPCVRALNDMCREKHIQLDYSERDFEKIWSIRNE